MAIELGVIPANTLPKNILLKDLKDLLLVHPAFFRKSKLETLAKQYNIDVIFIPKYHCELNPIEGAWCQMKNFFRRINNQNADEFVPMVKQSRDKFLESDVNKDLWKRFFKIVQAYKSGKSYKQVLNEFYGPSYKEEVKYHRRIGETKF